MAEETESFEDGLIEVELSEEDGLIEVDLSEEDRDTLIMIYLSNSLTTQSLEVFQVTLNQMDIKTAIYQAILNESVISALEDQISREIIKASNEATGKNNDANVES